jgi:hypothetical protein
MLKDAIFFNLFYTRFPYIIMKSSYTIQYVLSHGGRLAADPRSWLVFLAASMIALGVLNDVLQAGCYAPAMYP